MSRLLTTALSAVTMVALGIVALQYQAQERASESLTGANAEALNLTNQVATDAMTIAGNGLPRLLMVVIIVMLIIMLLLIR